MRGRQKGTAIDCCCCCYYCYIGRKREKLRRRCIRLQLSLHIRRDQYLPRGTSAQRDRSIARSTRKVVWRQPEQIKRTRFPLRWTTDDGDVCTGEGEHVSQKARTRSLRMIPYKEEFKGLVRLILIKKKNLKIKRSQVKRSEIKSRI